MLTFTNYEIDLRSIPGEICLTFYVCNCPCHCKGCSSPWLWEPGKYELTTEVLQKAAKKYPYISCILLMGGDSDLSQCMKLADFTAETLHKKAAIYSGQDFLEAYIMRHFDYIKVGHWDEVRGPLNCPTTNQSLWKKLSMFAFENITRLFWTKQNEWHEVQEKHIKEELRR